MTTTTKMVEELRARAASYRAKADALELAAADFNGDLHHKAKDAFAGKLAAAIGARAPTNGHGPAASAAPPRKWTRGELAAKFEVIRTALDGANRTSRELQTILADRGYQLSVAWVGKLVRFAGARSLGRGGKARWTLTGKQPSRKGSARARKGSARGAHPNKLDLLKQVLRDAGEPLSSKAIVAAYKAAGGRGGLTGIGNYVMNGHLTRNKQGEYGLGPKADATA